MIQKLSVLLLVLLVVISVNAQDAYLNASSEQDEKVYKSEQAYKVKTYKQKFKSDKPKNIIFLIGDGMGVSQVYAGKTANKGRLFLDNCKYIGFNETQSSNNYITDSAAGGTALSSGVRTYNGAIGVNPDTIPVETILEAAEAKGLATGLVSTSTITHATPASFIAHQANRGMYEAIAADFLKTDIDVFIGGGKAHFTQRKDGRNLVEELKQKGYTVKETMAEVQTVKKGKLAGLIEDGDAGRMAHRKNMLPEATKTAIDILKKNDKGFFMMVEGSQIDWGGHAQSTQYIVEDMLDFDKVIGKALDFASKDGETLVLVTADHETGGMALTGGNIEEGFVRGGYPTKGHTGVMVPIFAYGPGAEKFIGIMKNTDIHDKMKKLLLGN